MKFFQKRWVAWSVTVIMILCALGIGQFKTGSTTLAPEPSISAPVADISNSSNYLKYVVDRAEVLSNDTEKRISEYNSGFDKRYGSLLAVVTLKNTPLSDIEETAYDWADDLGLGGYDLLVLYDVTDDYCQYLYGADLEPYAGSALDNVFQNLFSQSADKSFEQQILIVYQNLANWYAKTNLGSSHQSTSGNFSLFSLIITIIFWIFVIKLILRLFRRSGSFFFFPGFRTRTWRRTSYHTGANFNQFNAQNRSSNSFRSGGAGGSFHSTGSNRGGSFRGSGSGGFGGSRSGGGSRGGSFRKGR